jgi:diacylglycerol kinase family enzyme
VGLAAIEAVPSFRTFAVRADVDGVYWEGRVVQIVVGNTRRYGGFTRMTADAFIDDGLLDACFFTPEGALNAGKQVLSLLVRQRPSETTSEMYRIKRLTVYAPSVMPLQLDGGAIDQDDIEPEDEGVVYEFSVVPRGVTVLIPRTYDGELLQSVALHDAEMSLNGKKHKHRKKKDRKG